MPTRQSELTGGKECLVVGCGCCGCLLVVVVVVVAFLK